MGGSQIQRIMFSAIMIFLWSPTFYSYVFIISIIIYIFIYIYHFNYIIFLVMFMILKIEGLILLWWKG
jgi:hypothetical protein